MDGVIVYPRRFASLVKLEHTVFALPFAYVGAFLALDEVPSAAEIVWLTLAMVGARSFAMAREPPRGRRHRRAQSAHGEPRAATRDACALAGAGVLRRLAGRLPARRLQPRPGRALAVADPGRDVRRLPVPEAGHVAQSRVARRDARPCARGRLGGDDRRAAARSVAARRRRRCLGGRLRPPLRRLRHRGRPCAGSPLVPGPLRRSRGVLGRPRAPRRDRGAARLGRRRARLRRLLLARRRRRRGAARVRARDRLAGRPPPPEHGVLHAERRDQHRVLRFVLLDVAA